MSTMSDRLAALERAVQSLQANPAASLRFGSVTGVEGGFARVQLPDGQNMVSALIPTMQPRVLKDQDIKMPDIGEPVVCAFAGQGLETGVLLGACYSPVTPDPGQPPHMDYHRYEDGTELWYDREEHKLIAKVKGDVEAEITGNVQATIEGNLTAKVQQKASVHAQGEMALHSDIKLNLRAPAIVMQGFLLHEDYEGNPGNGILRGSYVLREGSLSVPDDNISTGQQLIATVDANIGGIQFTPHKHLGVMPGTGTTDKPVGG